MGGAAKSETHEPTAVVVFGHDDKGKPHASAFAASDAELAEKAAGLMGMNVLRPAPTNSRRSPPNCPAAGCSVRAGRSLPP